MKISIIMTSFNYASVIGEAIESVINQTYTNWELIIVDDASTDNSVEVIKRYLKDSRIKLFINEKNLGLAKSVQRGLKESQGEWIAFLESDDKFYPDSIKEKVKAIETGADIIFTDLEMFGEEDKINDYQKKYFDKINSEFLSLDSSKFIDDFQNIITTVNIIPTFSVVMLKKNLLEKCKFKFIYPHWLDYYLWAQLSYCKVFYINKKLTQWRMHSGSYTNLCSLNSIKNFIASTQIFTLAQSHKRTIVKPFIILDFIRKKLIYVKYDKKSIKINIGSGAFIIEKKF